MVTTEPTPSLQASAAHLEQIALARNSLGYYIKLVHNWRVRRHQRPWLTAIDQLLQGDLQDAEGRPSHKLMVLSWRGSGKSATAIDTCGYLIGRLFRSGLPNPHIGYISYSDNVARERGGRAVRDLIDTNKLYGSLLFPGVTVDPERKSLEGWAISSAKGDPNPTIRACGMNSSVAGHRFDHLLVLDDAFDPEAWASVAEKDSIWHTYLNVVKPTIVLGYTPILLLGTRYAQDDLPGRILETETGWTVIRTPARLEDGASAWPYESTAEDGNPHGFTPSELDLLAHDDAYSFLTQYQCLPPQAQGHIFRFGSINEGPLPKHDDIGAIYQSWDTAFTAKSRSSFNAMIEAILLKNRRALCITRVFCERMEHHYLQPTVDREKARAYEEYGMVPKVIVENKASGQTVQGARRINITNKDLESRAHNVSSPLHNGDVWLKEGFHAWKQPYIDELQAFPFGQYNDRVAATVLLLEEVFKKKTIQWPLPELVVNYGGFNR